MISYNFILGYTNSSYDEPAGGIISSPNYPGSYLDGLACTYLIDLRASADNVRLQFLDFQTESGYDNVSVFKCFTFTLLLWIHAGS